MRKRWLLVAILLVALLAGASYWLKRGIYIGSTLVNDPWSLRCQYLTMTGVTEVVRLHPKEFDNLFELECPRFAD
jgi:hypothetical protein